MLQLCESWGMKDEPNIHLSPDDQARLEGWVGGQLAAETGLACPDRSAVSAGSGVTAIVRATGKTKRTAYRGHDRLAHGVR